MSEKLEFDLLVKQNDLNKTLKEASTQAQTFSSIFAGAQPKIKVIGDELNKINLKGLNEEVKKVGESTSIAGDFMDQFKFQTLGVAAGQFAFQALNSAISLVKSAIFDSIAAYTESEDAVNRLNQALNASGSYSKAASDDLVLFSREIQRSSIYSDEAILAQVSYAKSLGLSIEQSKNLVRASVELSAQLGGSLEESTTKLVRAMSGELPRSVKALIPELKELTVEQLRTGAAADIIAEKFSGAAASQLNTYNGKVANLKNSVNDLQESIGELIVTSQPYKDFLTSTKNAIEAIRGTSIATSMASGEYGLLSKTTTQLTSDIKILSERVLVLKEDLKKEEGDRSFWDKITGGAAASKFQLDILEQAMKKLQDRLASGMAPAAPTDSGRTLGLTPEQEESIKKSNEKVKQLDLDLISERKRMRDQEAINVMTEEEGKKEAEISSILDFETRKAESDAVLKEGQLSSKLTFEERKAELDVIAGEKRLALLQANAKSEVSLNDLKNKQKEDADKKAVDAKKKLDAEELKMMEGKFAAAQSFLSLGIALSKQGSTAAKVLASANATVNTYMGVTKVLADPLIPVLARPYFIAATIATGLASVASINGIQFENGGIVGDVSGATVGRDNRTATIRDGEMILNGEDQRTLFNAIKSGSFGGGSINLVVDGRVLATVLREQIQGGFRLA
jgi:hypothetical protein